MRDNKMISFKGSELDKIREEEARRDYPKYDPKSTKWVVNLTQGSELSVIRQNFRHGFISLGWFSSNEKIHMCDFYTEHGDREIMIINKKKQKILMKAAQKFADELNECHY